MRNAKATTNPVIFTTISRLRLHLSMIACRTATEYGKYRFEGSGPATLFYDGSPADLAIVAEHGFIAGMNKRVSTRVFATVAEGLAAAREAGVPVCDGASVGCACRNDDEK